MKRLISLLVATVLTVAIGLPSSLAQTKYVMEGEQELAVIGSSTLHNWEMVTYTATGEGLFWIENEKIVKTQDLTISFEVVSLESGKGRIMDRNARRALKAEEHPRITFELLSIAIDEEGQQKAYGNLTAAGVTKPLSFNMSYLFNDKLLEVRARTSFLLTDFEIKPPVALAGTLRTGDAVSLDVVLEFKESEEKTQ